MNIALAYNIRHVKPDLDNPQYLKEAEFDEPSTIKGIAQALKTLGHRVYPVEANEEAYLKFKRLKSQIDLVFNLSEGLHGRDREAQIPAMLEMLQIPYTGPGPLGYALGLDKAKAKEVLKANNVPTPQWLLVEKISELKPKMINFYPVIAKPVGEGSSKGIQAKNLVKNFPELKKITLELLKKFQQKVLIEEFLPGREFTVAIIGNPPRVLPIIEVTFDKLPHNLPQFDHFEAKWIYDNPLEKADPLVCPAKISHKLRREIKRISLNIFQALNMADWARLDFRLDRYGKPQVIEINCPPGITPDPQENSRYPRAARAAGLSYQKMLLTILKSTCRRYHIRYHK